MFGPYRKIVLWAYENNETFQLMSSQTRKLAKNIVALALGGLAAQAAFIFIEALLARRLGQESYGTFSTVFVLSTTALLFIDLGMSWKQVQDGSRYPEKIAEQLGTTLVLKAVFFIISYPLLILVLNALEYNTTTIGFFSVFYLFALAMASQESLAAVYVAKQRMEVNAFFQGVTPLIILALAWFFVSSEKGITTVAIAYVGGAFIVNIIWAIFCFKEIRPTIKIRDSWKIIKGSYQFGLSGLLSQIFLKIDILMLSFLRDMAEVGMYAAGYKLLDFAYKIPIMAMRVFSPLLFQKSTDDKTGYRVISDAMLRGAVIAGMTTSILFYILATPIIILVFGKDFFSSIIILEVLSAGFAIKFISIAIETVLMTSDMQKQRVVSFSAATGLNVIINIILIPVYGALGAAIGTIVSELVLLISFALYARQKLKIARTAWLIIWPALVALCIVIGSSFISANDFLKAGVAVGFFLALLFLFRYVRHAEIEQIVAGFRKLPKPE